ncbi:MAG: YIP1 family protein [Candidatus Eisenbacteria bacterium]|nr:YIP1 family protein [Candidatus Eisenbacteria bacterium]
MSPLVERMVRAAKLDARLYEEVETDTTALGPATIVVILSGLAAGIGMISVRGIGGLIAGTVVAVAAWYVWAYLIYLIGTRVLPGPETKTDPGELLRALGFASAPGVIRVLGIVPFLRDFVFFVSSVWMLATMVIAVRQALDYKSTARAVLVCAIGWLVQLVLLWLLQALLR